MTREYPSPCHDSIRHAIPEFQEHGRGPLPVEENIALSKLTANRRSDALAVIFQINSQGRIFVEGLAFKGSQTGRRRFEHWVTFIGDVRCRRRYVLPEPFQSCWAAIVEGLGVLYEDHGGQNWPETFLSDVLTNVAANDNCGEG